MRTQFANYRSGRAGRRGASSLAGRCGTALLWSLALPMTVGGLAAAQTSSSESPASDAVEAAEAAEAPSSSGESLPATGFSPTSAADGLPVAAADGAAGEADPGISAPELPSPPRLGKPLGPAIPLAEALRTKGDLTLRNAPMEAALFTIREVWQVNVVAGQNVTGTVNCVFNQAPLKEVLDAILLANGYSYRAVGDSLVVQDLRELGSAHPLFASVTIGLKHADPAEVVEAATLLKSANGQIRALPSARSIIVIDYEERVRTIREFVEQLDGNAGQHAESGDPSLVSELEVVYFHTQYIPAESARTPLMTVLSPQGRIEAMPTENRLIVVDFEDNIEMVRRVLMRIDRPRPQVRITALIYDLSLEDAERLGVNWSSAAKGNTVGADGTANQALELSTTTVLPTPLTDGSFTVRSLTRNFDINSVVRLMQTANDARLLADPNVTVLDNELAEWKSVSEIPYQQITQSELGGQIGTTAFKEAGITLRVRPMVAADGTIEMVVEPEFSRLAGFTPQDNQPIIDTRKAVTTVRVANRQTLVLGGLRQRSDNGEFNGVPLLKDLKYFGPLFRSRDTVVRESELIVFISPEIVGYDDPLKPRQYLGLETVDCRLNGMPQAEGCPGPCGTDAMPSEADGYLMALPPLEESESLPSPAASSDAGLRRERPTRSATVPLRPSFGDRFRSKTR